MNPRAASPSPTSGPLPAALPSGEGLTASAGADADGAVVESSGSAWVYCAFTEPETPEQQAA